MAQPDDPFAGWTPEQIAQGRRWAATWKGAGEALARIRLRELREISPYRALELLLAPGPPVGPMRTGSGLVEQQRWFMRMARHS